MNKRFLGLAFSAAMLPSGEVTLSKKDLTVLEVRTVVDAGDYISCVNGSHTATLDALKSKNGIQVEIPGKPPRISLGEGDSVIILQVRGLPRLTDRREYNPDEIEKATFSFMEIKVEKHLPPGPKIKVIERRERY